MTTQLHWAPIEQVATATPSPPAVVSSGKSPVARSAEPPASKHTTPAPKPLDTLKAVAVQIESYLRSASGTLDFSVDEPTGEAVITVRDASGDVIRQIPNEEALRLARSLGAKPNVLLDLIA